MWLHLDLDVIEPGTIPTEYSVPGGPSLEEVRALLAAVAGASDVLALEVAEYEREEALDAPEAPDAPDAPDAPAAPAAPAALPAELAIERVIEPVLARWRAAR